jgi:hypothetical protein
MRVQVNEAAGGHLTLRSEEEAHDLLEDMAAHDYHWCNERYNPRNNTSYEATCDFYGGFGHQSFECQVDGPQFNLQAEVDPYYASYQDMEQWQPHQEEFQPTFQDEEQCLNLEARLGALEETLAQFM